MESNFETTLFNIYKDSGLVKKKDSFYSCTVSFTKFRNLRNESANTHNRKKTQHTEGKDGISEHGSSAQENIDNFHYKLAGIPRALFSFLLEFPYHLIKFGYNFTKSTIAGNISAEGLKKAKINGFSAVRDLEEGVGNLTAIFHSTVGLYMIANAKYNKASYSGKFDDEFPNSSYTTGTSTGNTDKEFSDRLLRPLKLETDEKKYEPNDLTTEKVSSNLNKLSDEQLENLSIEQLNKLDLAVLDKKIIQKIFNASSPFSDKLNDLTTEKLQSILNQLSDKQLEKLSIEQLNKLDLAVLDKKIIQKIFNASSFFSDKLNGLTTEKLQSILNKLSDKQLEKLSIKQLNKLDLAVLEDNTIQKIFGINAPFKGKLGALTTEKLQSILNKLSDKQLKRIPTEKLKELNFSDLKPEKIQFILGKPETEEYKKRQDIINKTAN